jgi:hypothetical protein
MSAKVLSRDDMRCEISMAATRPVNREHGGVFDDVKIVLRESRMLKHGDFSPQDDHRNDQPDRDGRPDDAENSDVDRVVRRAEFSGGPFEEAHALAENEVDHSLFS